MSILQCLNDEIVYNHLKNRYRVNINESQEAIQMSMVGLKVKDRDKEISFYQEDIGLELLEKNETNAILGIKSENNPLAGGSGLYHMVF